MQVHEQLKERWTVASMAELAHVSASRFAVLYKKLFGVTPMEDLIDARLARARALLTSAGLSVGEAAAQTGFASLCYFSRLFRRRMGTTARDYCRRDLQRGESTEPTGEATTTWVATVPPGGAAGSATRSRSRQRGARRAASAGAPRRKG